MSNVRETMEYKRMEYFEIADNESIYPLKILRETIKVERLSLTLSPCGATQTHAWAHTHTHTHTHIHTEAGPDRPCGEQEPAVTFHFTSRWANDC